MPQEYNEVYNITMAQLHSNKHVDILKDCLPPCRKVGIKERVQFSHYNILSFQYKLGYKNVRQNLKIEILI